MEEKISLSEDQIENSVMYLPFSLIDEHLTQYLKEISLPKLPTSAENSNLIKLAKEGDVKARELFLRSNLRLGVWVAKKFKSRIYNNTVIDFMDIIQQANMGIIHAFEVFDLSKGVKFSTYAFWWCKQYVARFLQEKKHLVSVPVYLQDDFSKFLQIKKKLDVFIISEFHYPEIIKLTGWSDEKISKLISLDNLKVSSLDYSFQDDNQENYFRLPISKISYDNNSFDNDLLQRTIRVQMKLSLTLKEYTIVAMRFGFENYPPHTLEEIGQKFEVSRERIRQIEKIALKKLRESSDLMILAKEIL